MKRVILLLLPILVCVFVFPSGVNAFTAASDMITTSRPSAATPLNGNVAASSTSITVYDNSSIFLASDSARFWGQTQETLVVASASATRTALYFTSATTNAHTNGTVVTNAVTAKHTITFKLSQQASVGDILKVTFPGSGNTTASPSATTFAFNGLLNSNVTVGATSGVCDTIVVSAPDIQCTVSTLIPTTATVTITIGSSTPALINPTKTQTIGTGDLWKLTLKHTDSLSIIVEPDGKLAITTIESVFVQGVVDASITMTIAAINNGTNIKTDNDGCDAWFSFLTNSGQNPTATSVNLGTIGTSMTYAAQKITISTNAPSGYVLTATASGRLINPASGRSFPNAQGATHLTANNVPIPAAMSAGTEAFGISACGTDSASDATPIFDTSPGRFGNPSNSAGNAYYYSLATNTGIVTSSITSIVYGVTASGTTPAGTYSTTLTYVATPTF
ncbi:MAG: hypothetical protein V1697_02945 [Candidatus Levyibacteriota bacterium]